MQTIGKIVIIFLVGALCMLRSTTVSAEILNLTYNTAYTFPGGVTRTGSGSSQLDTQTGGVAGNMGFSMPLADGGQAGWWIPILICAAICWQEPAYGGLSLLDLAGDNIFATMLTDFGAAGTAIFTSQVTAGIASITGDLSGVNLTLLPSLPNIDVTASALITGAGPGAATGSATASLASTGLVITNTVSYDFLGNPTLVLPNPALINSVASIAEITPTSYTFDGTIDGQVIPEPSTYLLFAVGILGVIGMGYRQRKKVA